MMTRKLPNLIIVAGDGRNSGKTTMCCRIIKESGAGRLIAIKISPHFHEQGKGVNLICENEGFRIYQETNRDTGKDSAEMLNAGAGKVYFIQTGERFVDKAFEEVLKYIPSGDPIVCESPSLIKHYEPGVFVIMVSENSAGRKDISELKKHLHIEFSLSELNETIRLPFGWTGREWSIR